MTPEKLILTIYDAVWLVAKKAAELWQSYPNTRVKHLALNGRPRTRKKNMRRIGRELKRRLKHDT